MPAWLRQTADRHKVLSRLWENSSDNVTTEALGVEDSMHEDSYMLGEKQPGGQKARLFVPSYLPSPPLANVHVEDFVLMEGAMCVLMDHREETSRNHTPKHEQDVPSVPLICRLASAVTVTACSLQSFD